MRWWPMTMECPPGMARARNGERGCDYPPGGQARQQYNVLQNRFAPGGPAMSTATAAPRRVIYGGSGKAARTWDDFDRIVATLRKLENDETLLVQSGKPVGVVRTHELAPRVLIANSLLVPRWETCEDFRKLAAMGL